MSKVISFRLDINNPREAQALEVLQSLCEEGYSIRRIVTDALLYPDVSGLSKDAPDHGELVEIIIQINNLLAQLDVIKVQTLEQKGHKTKLPDTFLSSIQKSVKSGVRLD